MKIARSIKISVKQLTAHKVRTVLSLIGIVIGVSAVIVMVAIGSGAQREIMNRIEEMGTHLIVVNAAEVQRSPGRREMRGTVTTLTIQDAEALQQKIPSITAAAPVQSRRLQVRHGNRTSNVNIVGTHPSFQDIRNFRVRTGSFFDEHDDIVMRRVAVLGAGVHRSMFDERNVIGETIRIGTVPFEIIGVMEARGVDLDGVDQDDQIFIPVRTALRRVFNLSWIQSVYIQARNQEVMESTAVHIREILRERHRLFPEDQTDDFTIHTQLELLETHRETSEAFTLLIASMAGISLLIGGIGILAVMLITVRERINEIGLRLAVGARKKDVMTQFLIEASLLGIGGGLVGIAFGLAASLVIGFATAWSTTVMIRPVLFAFLFSLGIGLIFGVFPARKASLLDPIEALRSE
ncbi:MAG: ABC transporter permease [Balneolales bacterium]